jgi:hypothetical protein
MSVRVVTALAAAATILGACGSARGPAVYERAGVSAEQKKADEAQCTKVALDTAGPRAAAPLAVDRDAVERCMRARGYRVATPK